MKKIDSKSISRTAKTILATYSTHKVYGLLKKQKKKQKKNQRFVGLGLFSDITVVLLLFKSLVLAHSPLYRLWLCRPIFSPPYSLTQSLSRMDSFGFILKKIHRFFYS